LDGDLQVDVAIVGAGFTGLWTARELLRRDPTVRIAILEAQHVGFGASGRNGGWVSALYPLSDAAVQRRRGLATWQSQRDLLRRSVVSFGAALAQDNIDGDFVQGGTITFARSALQRARLSTGLATDERWLEGDEMAEVGQVAGAIGAHFLPHCARIHPGKVVAGLAHVLEAAGVQIFEDSPVTHIEPRGAGQPAHARTAQGVVYADYVVRATEGYTATMAGHRRDIAPVYSLMIATAPLSPDFWATYGFSGMPTFCDDRNLIIYGQRTADNRIAFGGRGAPYHFGSAISPRFDQDPGVFRALESTLRELFPTLDAPITHRWGGPLAMPRRREPSVVVDHASGLAHAGGYTGDGVTLSRVCAEALADLMTKPASRTPVTALPFVNESFRKWETEPLRWLGINAGLQLAARADRFESRGREGWPHALLQRLLGERN
jgi:glycine/D-amino acid oxidase-like deaminating enzyme